MAYEDARERYIARTQGGYPTRERTPRRRLQSPDKVYSRGLGSFKNKFRNIGRALKDEFGGSVMAGELRSDLDSTSGYLSGGSSLENLSKKQQADLFGTLGITPNTSVVPTSGGGINLDADFPQQTEDHSTDPWQGWNADFPQQTEDHSTDEYNRAILQDKNFRDPFMSSLIDRDYMVNYPDYYRSKPQYMDMGSDVFGPQSTIGPGAQGFIPREKSWWSNLNPMNWFNRGGIMGLRR